MFAQTTQATEFILNCLSTLLKISLNSSMSRQATIVQYSQKSQANSFSLPIHICYLRLSRTQVTSQMLRPGLWIQNISL